MGVNQPQSAKVPELKTPFVKKEIPCVNQPQSAKAPEPFKVGDRVIWDSCPGFCTDQNPFLITAIEGDCAMLDFIENPVLLTALRFEQEENHE